MSFYNLLIGNILWQYQLLKHTLLIEMQTDLTNFENEVSITWCLGKTQFPLLKLTTVWQHMCGFPPIHTPSNLATPAECSTIQFSLTSFTWKIASDSTGQGLSLTRLLPTTFPTTQAQLVICTSDWWTVNQRFPQAPSQVQLICKSHSQNSGKQFTY